MGKNRNHWLVSSIFSKNPADNEGLGKICIIKLMPTKRRANHTQSESFSTSWLANNTLGIFFGFLEIAIVGSIYAVLTSQYPSFKQAGYAVVLAGALQGVIIGQWQYKALKLNFPKISEVNWVLLSALASTLIWFSIIFLPYIKIFPTLTQSASAGSQAYTHAAQLLKFSPLYIFIISFLAGLFLGYILSFLQWIELSKHVKASFKWIFFNSLAWALGFSVIITLMSKLPYTNLPSLILSALFTFFVSAAIISIISLPGVQSLKNSKN